MLIITKTPKVAIDTTIHDAFAVVAPEDDTPDNDALDVATAVRARHADFVAGYVPASSSITWLNDATQWSHGDPVATTADPTVAFVGIPGGSSVPAPRGPRRLREPDPGERPERNPAAFADLHTVVRFTNGGTFRRGR